MRVHLRSKNDKDLSGKYPSIAAALAKLPHETVIDGEVVAVDDAGKPSFNLLQNYGSSTAPLVYVFDVLILAGRDVMDEPFASRHDLLKNEVLAKLGGPIRESSQFDAKLGDLIRAAKGQGLEGLVAKRKDSRYERGQRSGDWHRMRLNEQQEFVILAARGLHGTSMHSSSGTTMARDSHYETARLLRPGPSAE